MSHTIMVAESSPKTDESGILLKFNLIPLFKFVLSLPLIGFFLCTTLSLINNFEASTATHCRVANYLPSISSSIGGFTPQRYIWRICIALHCAPRFFVAAMYYHHFSSYKISPLYQFLVFLNTSLNVIENLCLVFLSIISSTENYHFHENSFIGFMTFSELYMLLTIILFYWSRRAEAPLSEKDKKSFRLKIAFFALNLSSFFIAIYFFFRHNSYCEPGVYTWFAFCEYAVVLTNIAYHGTAFVDFEDSQLVVLHENNHKRKPS